MSIEQAPARPGRPARPPTGADRLAQVLVAEGVTDVFTLCGNHLLPIYQSLVDAGIRLVDTRSEGSAAMAADGYARAGRRLGVALVTGGPGHTNALTGLATAHSSSTPVLLLSGSSSLETRGLGAHQELEQVASARPYVKYAAEAGSDGEVGELLRAATRAMQSAPTGAGFLSLPIDVMQGGAAVDPSSAPHGAAAAEPDGHGPPDVARVDHILASARRPVAIVGAGAYWEHAEQAIAAYCRSTQIPVFTMGVARGVLPDDGDLCFGYPDASITPTGKLISEADVVLLFGHRLDYRFRFGETFRNALAVVEFGTQGRPLGARLDTSIAVSGPTTAALAALTPTVGPAVADARGEWRARIGEVYVRANVPPGPLAPEGENGRLDPLDVAWSIRAAIPPETTICYDAGDFLQWARGVLPATGPGRWLRAGRMSTCGSGLPMAMGAAAAGHTPTLAITGDGSLGYHIADLESLARQGLPVVVLVGNNAAWAAELNLQEGLYAPAYRVASKLNEVDHVRIAQGFGVTAERATTLKEVEEILGALLQQDIPALLEVPVTSRPSPLIQAAVSRGGFV